MLLCRFFAGLFGSAPVTNTGGVLGDIWSPTQRGTAIVGYAFAVVGGPTLGFVAFHRRFTPANHVLDQSLAALSSRVTYDGGGPNT